jgi:hypothetical protein
VLFDAASPSRIRKLSKSAQAIINGTAHALRSDWIVRPYILNDIEKVVGCVRRPANLHLGEHLVKTSRDFVVSEKLTAIKPAQARSYLLPKPGIVFQVAFHQLLHVVICVTVILSGDAG